MNLNKNNQSSAPQKITSKAFAEVIESSLTQWTAQSWQWDMFPSFGSLVYVKQQKRTLIGIVHEIRTGSMDPLRHPFPYQKTEEELLAEQPQIFEFLKTTFSSLALGYLEHGTLVHQIPPEPAKIHAFVQQADTSLTKQFLHQDKYLPLLFNLSHELCNVDELLLALLKEKARHGMMTAQHLETFIDTYTLLTGNDYRRLKLLINRITSII